MYKYKFKVIFYNYVGNVFVFLHQSSPLGLIKGQCLDTLGAMMFCPPTVHGQLVTEDSPCYFTHAL